MIRRRRKFTLIFTVNATVWISILARIASISSIILKELSPASRTIIIRFDGCLRPPRDIGYPTIAQRLAISSSCISILQEKVQHADDGGDDGNNIVDQNARTCEVPIAVGVKQLSIVPGITSQHTEYEGLLMGLEWIHENMESIIQPRRDTNDSILYNCKFNNNISVVIEGDCKTVIDQLSGKSIPRKLQYPQEQARILLYQISEQLENCNGNVDKSLRTTNGIWNFNHIPRNQNFICDNLCSNLMNLVAHQAWEGCIDQIEREHESFKDSRTKRSINDGQFIVQKLLGTHLHAENSKIKYSLRPLLYNKLAAFATETEEFGVLVDIGQRMVHESSMCFNIKSMGDRARRSAVQCEGIKHQIIGYSGLGNTRKARFLERKYPALLSSLDDPTLIEISSDNISIVEQFRQFGNEVHSWDENIPSTWTNLLSKWYDAARARYNSDNDEAPLWANATS